MPIPLCQWNNIIILLLLFPFFLSSYSISLSPFLPLSLSYLFSFLSLSLSLLPFFLFSYKKELMERRYYPGDEYVDWVSMDGYNVAKAESWSHWMEPVEVFGDMVIY